MNVCMPVNEEQGLDSSICAHFGGTPFFLLVDTDTRHCRTLARKRAEHAHGQCSPLAALAGERIDTMIVGGIGPGAVAGLVAAGIRVYLAEHATAAENVDALIAGNLRVHSAADTCAHTHDGGASDGGHGCCGHG